MTLALIQVSKEMTARDISWGGKGWYGRQSYHFNVQTA
jgi:hypothetical protein